MPTQERPVILLISLDLQPWFDEMYQSLIDQITAKATLKRAESPATVKQALSENPQAVLIPNEALTKRKNAQLWSAVLDYVQHGGGTAICMGMFSSFIKPLDFKPFFAKAGLSWDKGDYHRTTSSIKRDNVPREVQPFLAEAYSQKGIYLNGVGVGDAWYAPTEDSVIESLVFAPDSVSTNTIPVAMAKVGDGRLGYVGDCNGEAESHLVVVAMCGLFA